MRQFKGSNLIFRFTARLDVKFVPLWRNRTGRRWTKKPQGQASSLGYQETPRLT